MVGQNTEDTNYIVCQCRVAIIITPVSSRRMLHVFKLFCHVYANEKEPFNASTTIS